MTKPITQLLNTAKYRHADQTKRDINTVINFYKSLTPKLERYTYPNGLSKELICLDGTIPVVFRDVTYHIPVGIFLSDNHPFEAPIFYVRPTRDMTIKTGRHVDGSGRVYLPYLSEWKKEASDLFSAIQVMQFIFGQMCPVYQKAKDHEVSMPPLPPTFNPIGTNGTGPSSSTPGSISMPTPSANVYPFSSQTDPSSTVIPTYPPASNSSGTITEEHIRASLLSAVEDRLKFRAKESIHQIQDEIEVLKKTSNDLNRGKIKLDEMKTRMAMEVSQITGAKLKLQELDDQLQEFIIKYDKEGEDINPDEVYGPTQPLFKQLLDAYAEENALVDAIYYTGEGLHKGVITLDVFLKSVRDLSRRQFMLRALMHACRTKASLPN